MPQIRFLYILVLLLLGSLPLNAYAGYTGEPSQFFTSEDKEKTYSVFAEAVADLIYDRKAKAQTDDARIDFYGGRIGLVYKETFILYGGAGAAKVEEEFIATGGRRIRWESDYGFTWLVGGIFKLYEKKLKDFHNSRLLVDIDIQYRNTDLDSDTITIDSIQYSLPRSEITYSSMEYNDWHLALACGLDMGKFSPYAGIRYSDFESCLRVVEGGRLYEKDNIEADNNFGVFIGTGLELADSLRAHLEAGFIDQDSINAALSWKF